MKSRTGAWYALAVTPGRESKIRERILDRLDRRGITVPELSIVCPEEEVIVDSPKGDPERKRRMSMPGYLLLFCRRLNEDAINTMVLVSGVIEFLGGNQKPTALPDQEVDKLVGADHQARPAAVKKVSIFHEGDEVRIIEGPLSDFTGKLSQVNEDTGLAHVDVEIFGRLTPTQVKLRQLRPA